MRSRDAERAAYYQENSAPMDLLSSELAVFRWVFTQILRNNALSNSLSATC